MNKTSNKIEEISRNLRLAEETIDKLAKDVERYQAEFIDIYPDYLDEYFKDEFEDKVLFVKYDDDEYGGRNFYKCKYSGIKKEISFKFSVIFTVIEGFVTPLQRIAKNSCKLSIDAGSELIIPLDTYWTFFDYKPNLSEKLEYISESDYLQEKRHIENRLEVLKKNTITDKKGNEITAEDKVKYLSIFDKEPFIGEVAFVANNRIYLNGEGRAFHLAVGKIEKTI